MKVRDDHFPDYMKMHLLSEYLLDRFANYRYFVEKVAQYTFSVSGLTYCIEYPLECTTAGILGAHFTGRDDRTIPTNILELASLQ